MRSTDFAGQYIKDADKEIIRYLKDAGSLYRHDTIQHSYPFCYRSDTPLIYRAIPSWYVRVTDIRDKLLKANEQIRWVPEHIKEGRFGNWLEERHRLVHLQEPGLGHADPDLDQRRQWPRALHRLRG